MSDSNFDRNWAVKFYRVFVILGITAGPVSVYLYINDVVQRNIDPVVVQIDQLKRDFVLLDRYERERSDVMARLLVLERTSEQKLDKVVAEQRDVNRDTKEALAKFNEQLHDIDTKLTVLDALSREIRTLTTPKQTRSPLGK